MQGYNYRSVLVSTPAGVAGTIQRGSIKRTQYKGQAFSSDLCRSALLNFVNGELRSVTALGVDGRTFARLEPTAKF